MHAFISCHLHCVWSTKERRRLITPALQQRLWPYLGGIARANKMAAVEIGGVEDQMLITSSDKPNIIAGEVSRRNSLNFCTNTTNRVMTQCWIEFCRPGGTRSDLNRKPADESAGCFRSSCGLLIA
jgi:hypothetical protein